MRLGTLDSHRTAADKTLSLVAILAALSPAPFACTPVPGPLEVADERIMLGCLSTTRRSAWPAAPLLTSSTVRSSHSDPSKRGPTMQAAHGSQRS